MSLSRVVLVWVMGLTLGAGSPTSVAAKSYTVDRIEVNASVRPDGSMTVTEEITYSFDGSFTFAYRDIPVSGGVRVTGVTVAEGGRQYEESPGDEPGTFYVSKTDGVAKVTWHYTAHNETRTFTFSYVVEGVVRRYEDTAELYYKFVGEEWDHPIGDASVRIHLPDGVRGSDIKAWAHGPLHGTVAIHPTGEVTLDVAPLPAHTYWEARVLCPPRVFPDVPVSPGGGRMTAILTEEAGWAAEANAMREAAKRRAEVEILRAKERAARARRLLPVCVVLGLLGLGVWFVLFRRYGRPYTVRTHAAPGEIPSDHPPAIVSYLMSRTVSGSAIVATLVDLANRGYLKIREREKVTHDWFGRTKKKNDYSFETTGKERGELTEFEGDLLDFFMDEVGDSTSFTLSAIEESASKNRTRFRKWFREWVGTVTAYGKTLGFFEPYAAGAMVGNAVCGTAITAFGFYVCIATDSAAGVPAIGGGFFQAVLTIFLTRRTVEGRRLYVGWRQFKKHLARIGKALGPVTLDSDAWASYLAVAIVFGMHERVIPRLQMVDRDGHAVLPVWYFGLHGGTPGSGMSGLASGFSGMISSVSTTVSSASGAGGGASVGGGGGAGGGGGGAG